MLVEVASEVILDSLLIEQAGGVTDEDLDDLILLSLSEAITTSYVMVDAGEIEVDDWFLGLLLQRTPRHEG